MTTCAESFKQYYTRDPTRFWLLVITLIFLLGEFVCANLILVEESLIVSSIISRKFTDDDVIRCHMLTTTTTPKSQVSNETIPADDFQRRVLFGAQLVTHTVADIQLLLTLSLAARSIHLERGFRAHVLFVFPFSWTWACCMTLLSWPLLPMMATKSVDVVVKCAVARLLFIVDVWYLVGALVIYGLAFCGWRIHERKVMTLVARRNQLMSSTDDITSDLGYRARPVASGADHVLNPARNLDQHHPYYVSRPPQSTFSPEPVDNNTRHVVQDDGATRLETDETAYRYSETLPAEQTARRF